MTLRAASPGVSWIPRQKRGSTFVFIGYPMVGAELVVHPVFAGNDPVKIFCVEMILSGETVVVTTDGMLVD